MVKFYLKAQITELADLSLDNAYLDWQSSETDYTICTSSESVPLLELNAYSCSSAQITSTLNATECASDDQCDSE
jgi:hypothetical protein